MAWTILVTAAASLGTATMFFVVARRPLQARLAPPLQRAATAFALWWVAIGLALLTDAGRVLFGLAAEPDVAAYVTLSEAKIVLTSGALAALAAYVTFLHGGRRGWYGVIAVLAFAHMAFFLWAIERRLPAMVDVQTWSTRLVLQPSSGVPDPLQAAVFYLPGLGIAIAYAALWRKLTERDQRLRFYSVLAGLFLLFGVSAIQFNPHTSADDAWFLVFPALTVLLGFLVLRGVPRHAPMSRRPDAPASFDEKE